MFHLFTMQIGKMFHLFTYAYYPHLFQPEECENAYFKMDNVLIDDRRIHVDFSQSVSKVKWKGKGNNQI